MIIEPRPATDDDLVALVGEQAKDLMRRYGGADGGPDPVDPGAHFMVAVVGHEAVGCGAIQPVDSDTVELKRLYVRPAHRGRGVARRLLSALEALAVSGGYARIRLETGIRQPEAIGLYESSGYDPIGVYEPYEGNPFSRCFEKTMLVPAR
jgi:GNAT superfamily N-acetyltransferase